MKIRGRRVGVRVVAVLALLAALMVPGALPSAQAAPGIDIAKSADTDVRADQPITYTLTVTNPTSNPDAINEYNLSFADTLPAGVTYVSGSTAPATAGEPTIATDPATGQQTLTWPNVADVVPGATYQLTFQVLPDPATYPVGSTVTNPGAHVYANSDPQAAPEFDDSGVVVPGTYTESGVSGSASTTISAVTLTKSEPSPEAELLRGIHDHPTVYTLTVSATDAGASSGLVLVDYLPASLEFLGCGGVDNSSAREYVGAPSLTATPTPPNCLTPTSVSTVQNPPPNGSITYPAGIYTRVEWDLGPIPAGGNTVVRYAAGIPLRANALWPGAQPSPTGLTQIANLDNNTGPSTRELASEASATNIASVQGSYQGPVAPGGSPDILTSAKHTVSIEDVRMRKSVSPTTFTAGGRATYTLTVDTSEYASADFTITDVIPAGVCPLGGAGTNFASGSPAACAGSAGTAPSVPYDSVTQNSDGTFTVVFDSQSLPRNGTATITYQGAMLPTYLGGPLAGEPTTTGDSFTNHASLTGQTTPRPGTGETGQQTVGDTSSATQTTSGPTISKTVLPRSTTDATCPTDTSGYDHSANLPPADTQFRLGDVICFALRVDFPSTAQTRNPVVADFLPAGTIYVPGSAVDGDAASQAPWTAAATTRSVTFTLGTGPAGDKHVAQNAVFEVVLQARVVSAPITKAGLTGANQMKLSIQGSDGRRASTRTSTDVTLAPAPPAQVVKGVESVDSPATGPNPVNSNVDGSTVHGGSVATFRIDVTNGGTGVSAYSFGGTDVWDVLPVGITCADIGNVRVVPAPTTAPTVACTDPGDPDQPDFAGASSLSLLRVTAALDPSSATVDSQLLAPGATSSILYDLTIPTPAGVSTTYTDTAYVRSYQTLTDVPGRTATFLPQNNVDLTVPAASQNAPAATDASNVRTPGAVVAKTGTTSITETGNNTPNQATVGELVTYTYSVKVPAHSAVFDGDLTDALPTGFAVVPPASLSFFPDAGSTAIGALPAGVILNPATGEVTFPETYENSTATDQLFAVTLVTRVTTAALPTGQNNLTRTNTASFDSNLSEGGSALPTVSASYAVSVRQPAPTLTKSNNDPVPIGGDIVTYTVTATNPGSNRVPMHDSFITDCVPAGLTFQAFGPNPGQAPTTGTGTNGCASGTTRLVWAIGDLAPGGTVTRTYTVLVPVGVIAGTTYTNTATLTGSTLNDGQTDPLAPLNPNERGYAVSASSKVTIAGASITKSVTPTQATIGQRVTWTVTATVPPNTVFFDGSLIDRSPAGLGDRRVESFQCEVLSTPTQPCPLVNPPTELTPVPQSDGSTLTGYLIGDIPAVPFPRELVVNYSGVVLDQPVNVAGRLATNTAHTAWNVTNGSNPTSADFPYAQQGNTASATVTILEPDVGITKTVDDTTPDPGQPFTYSLDVRNSSGPNTSAAYNVRVTDVIPTGVVVDPTSITAGGAITGADPVNGGGTITWPDVTGGTGLAPGEDVQLTYSAQLAPSATLTGAALTNTAAVASYASLPTGGRTYTGPSTNAAVTPAFPRITTTKAAVDPAPAYVGQPFTWRVTVTNTGSAPAFGVDATDTLPEGWEYVDGSARISVAGGPADAEDPVTVLRVMRWTDIAVLDPGQSVVVTYQATPTSDVVTSPGVGSTVPQVNTAVADGEDATGATGNANGSYSAGPATAQTRIDSADLTLTKDHMDPTVAGGQATWTVKVTNAGADTAVGPFVVTDTLPAGVTFSSATGTGWSCSATGPTLTCQRTNPAETLAAGSSLPVITVVTDVSSATPSGTTFTNQASVTGRTFDPDLSNNTDSDTVTVTTSADLSITKAHTGQLEAGGTGTWTLDVANLGPSVSLGPITVTDTLPAGTSFVSAAGPSWSCTGSGRSVTCTRAADLPVGPAPQIVVQADIASSVTGSLLNTATVTGTTPDPVPGNNTDTDTGSVVTLADLSIQKAHIGTFTAGTSGTYRFRIFNDGPSDAASPVRITDTLPSVLTYTGFTSITGAWTCSASGPDVTCTLTGDLAVGDAAAVSITVDVDPSAPPAPIVNTGHVSSPTTDPILANNSDDDSTDVDQISDLSIAKSHTGPAVAGEDFPWSVAVHNHGPSSNPGPITVTDELPPGTSYVSATGTDWSCAATGRTVTCTYGVALAVGADASTITVTAAIAPDAGPAVLLNSVSVTSPLIDDDLTNNSDIDPTLVVDHADVQITKTRQGSGAVPAGSSVSFHLDATNNGPSDADNVVVTDTAPSGLLPTAATPPTGQGWTCDIAGQTVTCSRPTQPAGQTSTIVVTARVDPGLPAGTQLTNDSRIATSTGGDDPGNNTDSATITVSTSADLQLTKTHEAIPGGTAHSGDPVTYRVAVHNAGPSNADGPLTVVDTLPDGLSYVSAASPWTCTAGQPGAQDVTCVYTPANPLAADADAPDLLLTAQIDAAAAAGTYTNSATVTSPTPDPTPSNNTDTDDLSVTPAADVSIVKTHTGSARVGDPLDFVLTAHNAGPSDAADVVVTDTVPDGLTLISADGTGWDCTVTAPTLTCNLQAPLAAAATAEPITVVTTVEPSAYPSVSNTATISTSTGGDLPGDNSSTDTVPVPAQADIALSKVHVGDFVVGQHAVWHLIATNHGPTADPGPLTVVDDLPIGTSFVSGTGAGWACGAVGRLVTCRSTTGLDVGQIRTIALTVAVGPSAYPSVINTARISSPAEDLDPANNVATDPADVTPVSKLTIDKRVIDQDGRRVSFGIVVTNHGPNDTTAPIVVTDPVPAGLSLVSARGTGWVCATGGSTATCHYAAVVAVGGHTSRLTVVADLTGPEGSEAANTATASGGSVDPCPACGDTDSATAQVPSVKGEELSFTGADVGGVLGLALLLLVSGALLRTAARKRRRT